MIKSPCLNCENRVLHCHSTCEIYLTFLKENEERKELKRQFDKKKYGDLEYISESMKRNQKKKSKK